MGTLVYVFALICASNAFLHSMTEFASWDILTHLKGQVIFTKPSSEKCFGLALSFEYNWDELKNVHFRGLKRPNVTQEIYRNFNNFCTRIPFDAPHKTGFSSLPPHLKDFDEITVGQTFETTKNDDNTDKYIDYVYDDEELTNQRRFDVQVVFDQLWSGDISGVIPLSLMNEIITDFATNNVDDHAFRRTAIENALAKVAKVKPAYCNVPKKIAFVNVCFPMLDFFHHGFAVEVVHKGQFIENNTIYAQVSLPNHMFLAADSEDSFPVDLEKCDSVLRHDANTLHDPLLSVKRDFICPPDARPEKPLCNPPFLKGCEVILTDDRMLPKVRVFSDAYLVRSFSGNVDSMCPNRSSIEFPSPVNVLWKPTGECGYILENNVVIATMSGENFTTFLDNELNFQVDASLLDHYFHDKLSESPEQSVWRNQRKTLYVKKVNINTLILGTIEDLKPSVELKVIKETYNPFSTPVPSPFAAVVQTPTNHVSEEIYRIALIAMGTVNVVILFIFLGVLFVVLPRKKSASVAQEV